MKSHTSESTPNRGLRQGDLISSFIVVLAMDYFSALLNHMQKTKAIKGVLFNENCNLNYILFADDILIFIEDDDSAIRNLKNVIYLFEIASGLTISWSKSIFSPINYASYRSSFMENKWNIKNQFLPINYLRVPLDDKPNSLSF